MPPPSILRPDYPAPSGLVLLGPYSQGVALGCITLAFQAILS